MPGGDRTGPMGMGAMSGRGAGVCAGNNMPGYTSAGPGRGFGTGFGRGCGFGGKGRNRRHRFYAVGLPEGVPSDKGITPDQQPNPEMEKQTLRNHADALQRELDAVRKRLGEL